MNPLHKDYMIIISELLNSLILSQTFCCIYAVFVSNNNLPYEFCYIITTVFYYIIIHYAVLEKYIKKLQ